MDTGGLGLARGTVALRAHDPAWAAQYQDLAAALTPRFGTLVVALEHVGSTAVPSLAAKPIIDIAAGLTPAASTAQICAALDGSGWNFRGDKGENIGLLFVLESQPQVRIAHLHAVRFGSRAWAGYLQFRDLLTARADLRAHYSLLKMRLAAEHAGDRAAYTAGKESLVRQLLGR